MLFNAYLEFLFQEPLRETDDEISINGEALDNVRYAGGLQRVIDRVVNASESYEMGLNSKNNTL